MRAHVACGLSVMLILLGALPTVRAATTRYVTTLQDSGPGTLREAISLSASGDVIRFNTNGTLTLQTPLPDLSIPLSLVGPGKQLLTISGGNRVGLLQVTNANVTLSGLTLAFGFAASNNPVLGVLVNYGILTLSQCDIVNNRSEKGSGSIYNTGNLTLSSCLVANNSNLGIFANGGALRSQAGLLTVSNCTFSGNTTRSTPHDNIYFYPSCKGGAIYVGGGQARLVNTTIANNTAVGGDGMLYSNYGLGGADAEGGGLFVSDATARLVNCTISGNQASGGSGGWGFTSGGYGGWARGGGIFSKTSSVFLTNCTVINNWLAAGQGGWAGHGTPGGPGLTSGEGVQGIAPVVLRNTVLQSSAGTFTSAGYNLYEPGVTGTVAYAQGDLTNVNAGLGALLDNGGFAPTHMPIAGSAVIDAGVNSGLAFDARGQPRTINDPILPNAPGGDGTDIGAVELDPILRMTGIRRAGTGFQISFTTVQGKNYGVEFKLAGSDTPYRIPYVFPGTGGIVTITEPNFIPAPAVFFRAFER